MNIFKLLGFKKILFYFFKACLIMAFNTFFLLILIDEFYNLSAFTKIAWVRFIYFSLFYSILFYLFCSYLREEINNLENLSKLKPFKKKKKFLEEFKNSYKELNKKVIITQKKKKKISKIKLASKIFLILFLTIIYLGMIILYPGTYIFLLFILFLYFITGTIGKILTISFVILVLALPYILFFGDEDMKKDFCDIWIDEE